MPTKLTDLTELVSAPASGDFMHIVDVTDTTGGAAGTSKKITVTNLTSATNYITNIRGFTNNKSGAAINWQGYNSTFYPQMSIDFGNALTADFDIDWTEIIPAMVVQAIRPTPELTTFDGKLICSTSVTVDLSLWYVRPLCAGAAKGTLKHITTITKTTSPNVYECFTASLTQSLQKGDIIVPLLKTSGNGLVNFHGTFALKS